MQTKQNMAYIQRAKPEKTKTSKRAGHNHADIKKKYVGHNQNMQTRPSHAELRGMAGYWHTMLDNINTHSLQ